MLFLAGKNNCTVLAIPGVLPYPAGDESAPNHAKLLFALRSLCVRVYGCGEAEDLASKL
jgi:hypothetical protein